MEFSPRQGVPGLFIKLLGNRSRHTFGEYMGRRIISFLQLGFHGIDGQFNVVPPFCAISYGIAFVPFAFLFYCFIFLLM